MSVLTAFRAIWPWAVGFAGFWFVFIPATHGVFNGATIIGWGLVALSIMKLLRGRNV